MGLIKAPQKRVNRADGAAKKSLKAVKSEIVDPTCPLQRGHENSGKSSKAGFGCHSSDFIEK